MDGTSITGPPAPTHHAHRRWRDAAEQASRGAARGAALFLGLFTILNCVGAFRNAGFDANIWSIDLRPLPMAFSAPLLGTAGLLLAAYALAPHMRSWRRWATLAAAWLLMAVSAINAINYYRLLSRAAILSTAPIPFSLVLTLVLSYIFAAVALRPKVARDSFANLNRVVAALSLMACLIGFPAAQIFLFGKTDYRRKADAVVVFGAKVYSDGTLSDALADRVRTAIDLYHAGLTERLIFSGGPGDGDIDEPTAMANYARARGVPDSAITLDPHGLNTRSTVANTDALFDRLGVHRVLAVSHYYHLPRIKLTYQRQGREVYTVPATQRRPLDSERFQLAREIAALWVYYLRGLTG